MKNILIMVLSYDAPPYDELMKAQQGTWAKENVNGTIATCFYMGNGDCFYFVDHFNVLKFPVSDHYFKMQWKFKLCLDHFIEKNIPFTLFRTNSSSYINKALLRKHIETLPETNLYSGWSLESCVSGAGIIMSYDVVCKLAGLIPEGVQKEEDCLIGELLNMPILDDKSRFDVEDPLTAPLDRYHYRFKTEDRIKDAENMYKLHERIKQQK